MTKIDNKTGIRINLVKIIRKTINRVMKMKEI